ncbi:ketopantoate reductase family protein [Oceanobacillus sp. CAU 1775]
MKQIETVSLIGLGAIGAAYGTRLHNYLKSAFTVVASQERVSRYEATGIKVLDEFIDFNYITPETVTEPRDLVIFAVKNAELPEAVDAMKYHIGPDTIVLSLLNGISSEEEIYAKTKNEHILYSMCVGIDALKEDNHIRFSSLGKIFFGEREQTLSQDVQAVQELFEAAEIDYVVPDNIWKSIWSKFMLNVGINQTSAILHASYNYYQEIPELYEWMEEAMREVAAIAQKAGVDLTEEDVVSYRPVIKSLSPTSKTSMLQDIDNKRKTEVEYFAGKVCELGKQYHVPTPINDQLLRMILIKEKMNALDKSNR